MRAGASEREREGRELLVAIHLVDIFNRWRQFAPWMCDEFVRSLTNNSRQWKLTTQRNYIHTLTQHFVKFEMENVKEKHNENTTVTWYWYWLKHEHPRSRSYCPLIWMWRAHHIASHRIVLRDKEIENHVYRVLLCLFPEGIKRDTIVCICDQFYKRRQTHSDIWWPLISVTKILFVSPECFWQWTLCSASARTHTHKNTFCSR